MYCSLESKLVQSLWKIVWRFFKYSKKCNYHIIQQFHFWYLSEGNTNTNLRYLYTHVHCSTIYNNQDTDA